MNFSPGQLLHAKLNSETGRLHWRELERHFARGAVVKVAPGMDLVAVAVRFAQDDTAAIAAWLQTGQVGRASTEDAVAWPGRQSTFWAVVVAPWVLVQEIAAPEPA